MAKHTITFIEGDGVGPEVTLATRKIIEATGVSIDWEVCEAGAHVFKKGIQTGVPKETIDSIVKNKVALKGPLETPVGFGEKSANVTLRKMFDTFGNIRPVREIPGVITPYAGRHIDLVIVRENVEDLYAGIEYMQTPTVAECLKLITRMGCEKIVRLAFEFARSESRKLIHCATKANIMKLTEGLMKRTFEEIAKEYPDIEAQHIIVDNCAHQLVKKPEQFDVIVTTNMNGDILSDLGSALIGGLGFAPGANIGDQFAIFEAVHGSAPKYVGKNLINPTAVLLSGVMMLRYLHEFEAADMIEQALFVTLAHDKIQTRDIAGSNIFATTTTFTDAIIQNLGKKYKESAAHLYKPLELQNIRLKNLPMPERELLGIDIFIESQEDPVTIGSQLEGITMELPLKLTTISNRGVKVYPCERKIQSSLVDAFRCRFMKRDHGNNLENAQLTALIDCVARVFPWVHIEKLFMYDGKPSFSKDHGEED